MSDIIKGAGEVPLIGEVFEQELKIVFKRAPDGAGEVVFSFTPEMTEAITPEQRAAANVANQILKMLQIDMEGTQNARTTGTKQ